MSLRNILSHEDDIDFSQERQPAEDALERDLIDLSYIDHFTVCQVDMASLEVELQSLPDIKFWVLRIT